MKKIILALIFIFINIFIFSKDVTENMLTPYNGGGGVNLLSGDYTYSADEGSFVHSGNDIYSGNRYGDREMIANGGIWDDSYGLGEISKATMKANPIVITVNCPQGFFFVSQSNSAYKVPFELVAVQAYRNSNDNGDVQGEVHVISAENSTIELVYPESGTPDEDHWFWGSKNHSMWFDLVLILPSEKVNKNTLKYKGNLYTIAPGDDYSATVNITMTWAGRVTRSISMPFSGYVTEDGTSLELTFDSSLYINPTGYASNLDIRNDAGKWIGIADIQYLRYMGKGSQVAETDRSKLFLSASSDPTISSSDEFRLVHEDADPLLDLSRDEYIEYKARLFRSSDGVTSEVYDGKAYISGNTIWGGAGKEVGYLTTEERKSGTGGGSTHYSYSFNGSIQIKIEEPMVVMKEGRYEDELYLHIMSYR